jgi:hypothetical protein
MSRRRDDAGRLLGTHDSIACCKTALPGTKSSADLLSLKPFLSTPGAQPALARYLL